MFEERVLRIVTSDDLNYETLLKSKGFVSGAEEDSKIENKMIDPEENQED